jgi:dolichol-phosphate mannosyltransferase
VNAHKSLIFVPTYNECDNAPELFKQILALGLDADILFLDDNSPDGTGQILDELAAKHSCLRVIHRTGKLGIGSAHVDGIHWAYAHGYARLVTMDCDFTHQPADIPRMLEWAGKYDVVVASRWLQAGSLPGWNLLRRFLTGFGHFLTRCLLGMPQDATGAFRLYDLEKIPPCVFSAVKSRSYAFFFESLFVLRFNGYTIHEVPIVLPSRMYGHSKMDWREAARSALRVGKLFVAKTVNPGQFRVQKPADHGPTQSRQ